MFVHNLCSIEGQFLNASGGTVLFMQCLFKMFHLNLLFTVLLLHYLHLTRQHQHLIQGSSALTRSGFQHRVSCANFAVHKFQQLQGSLLDCSREVVQAKECALACVNSYNPPYFSFNIAVLPNENEKLRCELLSEDKFRSPNKVIVSQHFHLYSIKVSNLKSCNYSCFI